MKELMKKASGGPRLFNSVVSPMKKSAQVEYWALLEVIMGCVATLRVTTNHA